VPTVELLDYPIVVDTGALGDLGRLVRAHAPAHRYAVVTDEHVARHYLSAVCAALNDGAATTDRVHSVVIPSGEQHKTRDTWASVTDALLGYGCGRDTTVVALGGGVIGDLAGFVAATYMRGIPVVQIPTTLLAMVDASVGGKTAVDTPAGKNTVGAFHRPTLVVIDPMTLSSLPERELRSGFAEVIKHGVIADKGEIEAVVSIARQLGTGGAGALPMRELAALIERSVRIKARVVSADEKERGLRKVLNFGHTIGHGVEAASGYSLLHGEAIAIGMVAEARLGERVGLADSGTSRTIEEAVSAAGLPSRPPADIDPDRVLALMRSDKKQRRGVLEYSLPKRVGEMAGESSGWAMPIADADALGVLAAMV
jgi:3-dehydroquinate synthase